MRGRNIVGSICITRILRSSMIIIEIQRRSIFPKDKIAISFLDVITAYESVLFEDKPLFDLSVGFVFRYHSRIDSRSVGRFSAGQPHSKRKPASRNVVLHGTTHSLPSYSQCWSSIVDGISTVGRFSVGRSPSNSPMSSSIIDETLGNNR
ncbi:hypothetical protein HZH66_001248 [Vespula vulgaris]|uniref:Uncharacterized protein n=1 Tax=Vespula vulgaris TaxID=7454 RepID=A0A834NK39_VESVU|nr:hypothetical protein HZH66_001248 [Vespula vulgaris]